MPRPSHCENCQAKDPSAYLDGQWLCVKCMNDAVQERYNRPEDQERIAKFIAERKRGTMGTIEMPCDSGDVSDGHHTFDELYQHRMTLFVALMMSHKDLSWKSWHHSDGSMFDGAWFIAGMDFTTGPITYHLTSRHWSALDVRELTRAPEWDGHNSNDVILRIGYWLDSF